MHVVALASTPSSSPNSHSTAPGAPRPAVEAPWSLPPTDVLAHLGVGESGLDESEAATRLAAHGPNRLETATRTPWWRRVLAQFQDVLVYILLASALAKLVLRDWVDLAVIVAVVLVNAAVGLVQEGRAQKALDAISRMLTSHADTRRDGQWRDLPAEVLVPGDIVRVSAGHRVPADIRLLEAHDLQVEESALTGESTAAQKDVAPVAAEAGTGDRSSMLFSGTLVFVGSGLGVVTATGTATEIGRIQSMIAEVESLQTPLSKALGRFGTRLALAIVGLAVGILLVGTFVHDWPAGELVSAAIGFAVAAVPEGLPALVTITLALGVQQMARRRAITRKLPAVETLGSVTTICSDKTGTLTKNEMTARTIRTTAAEFVVRGLGYAPEGEVELAGDHVDASDRPDLAALAQVMVLCNDAQVTRDGADWQLVGSPTDGALAVLGPKLWFDPAGQRRSSVLPFSSATKYQAVLVEPGPRVDPGDPQGSREVRPNSGADRWVLLKGAPDRVLARCTWQVDGQGASAAVDRDMWTAWIDELGGRGLRVLAAARRRARHDEEVLTDTGLGDDLEMVGLVGIVDPPRPEAIRAIDDCRRAGIAVKMITGDHAGTALAIGREMGLVRGAGTPVLTGADLEEMDDVELQGVVREVDVYARTSPEHKVRIVRALQHHGEVVAMTGDGVNDAPALTQADVGVAMGVKGTEVTKEAADVVLGDDNFATIRAAVEEGRRIYDNVRKSVLFLLPTNGAQSLVVLFAVVCGLTLPLEPVQVLWINMVTAVTLSLALANERAERGIMDRAPRDPEAPLLSAAFLGRVLAVSALIGGVTVALFYWELGRGVELAEARTTAVNMLGIGQMAYLFNCRFMDASSFTRRVFTGNRVLWVSCAAMLVLQLVFVHAPFMHALFGTTVLPLRSWLLTGVLALGVFVVAEGIKWVGGSRVRSMADSGEELHR
ncbi:cation-translocating P-type ATPase [Brevibacterium litoralis]|uniref:cation-translocating P-type ATPase n=1 Tax=Brevibacterium litoralis TaxID=3138935 RepID=UPI0032ED52C1